MRKRNMLAVGVAALLMSATVAFAPASAQEEVVIEIPLTSVRAAEGSTTEIVRRAVLPDRIGLTCSVEIETSNNSSVHPGNDLIVSSGGGSVLLVDVEGFSDKVTSARGDLILGPEIIIELVMGPDERFSAGVIGIGCNGEEPPPPTSEPPPPTEPPPPSEPPPTEPPPSSTEPPTTEAPATTTTQPEVRGTSETPPASPDPDPVDASPTFTG